MYPHSQISVIIATFNRGLSLLETLNSLSVQTLDYDQYEVIVVDDGSNDSTADIVGKFIYDHPRMQIKFLRHEINQLKSAACNTGIRAARYELIAFTDDDTRPIPSWLETHIKGHNIENKPIAVIGLVLFPDLWEKNSNLVHFRNENYRKSEILSKNNNGQLPPIRFIGCNVSLPRSVLNSVGLFNEQINRGQDGELGTRVYMMGVPLIYENTAIVYHYAEFVLSLEKSLSSFRKYYENDLFLIDSRFSWVMEKFGSWFIEPYDPTYDNFQRMVVKEIVRVLALRPFQRLGIWVLNRTDKIRWLYCRLMYQYVYACEAIDGINQGQKKINKIIHCI